jgi:hypothetical protein
MLAAGFKEGSTTGPLELNKYDLILADYMAIKNGFRASLAPTLLTLILSTVLLAVTNNEIIGGFWPAWIILAIVTLVYIYALMTYVHLAETIVRDDGFKKLSAFLWVLPWFDIEDRPKA